MSNNVSATFRTAIYAQQTDQVPLILITISHDGLESDICLVNDTKSLVSRGIEHIGLPLGVNLPGDSDENISTVSLSIDNVDRQIIKTIRELQTPPTIVLELVLADSPDVVEAGPFEFVLTNASYNEQTIAATIGYEDILNQSWPGFNFTPSDFPGLF